MDLEAITAPRSRNKLYFAAVSANLLYISAGSVIAWPMVSTPKFLEDHILTKEQINWISSFFALGAVFGPIVSALTIDKIGRKLSLYLHAIAFFISWIILGLTESYTGILIGRFLGGMGVGGSYAGLSIYLAEIADNDARWKIGSMSQFFVTLGLLLHYTLGPFASREVLLICSGYAALIFGFTYSFMPESPYYLIQNGKKIEAITTLCWLRGNLRPMHVEKEIRNIQEFIKRSGKWTDMFLKKGLLKPLLAGLFLMTLQQICGFAFISSLTQITLHNVDLKISPPLALIGVTIINLIASGITPGLVQRYGLKIVLGISVILVASSYIILGIFLLMQLFSTLSFTFMVLVNAFFCLGISSIPWVFVAEMFPMYLKGKAVALTGMYNWLLAWIFLIFSSLWVHGTFLIILGCLDILGFCCIWIFIPNTKKLSILEIQDLMTENEKSTENVVVAKG